ncbi:hypothetical protein KKH23_10015 [Patescibacteria group bacterium]|uniref:Uncharacterized protein n=1 Tax=viral metagenome TaxID=1070528 RepID=A0A6M3MHF9_9ZZZZ|nr:hypothetical protein [Patescibacteria group bacterium]MBU0847507.1 hypothetical protein [Patescibacteria group bacterium]
MEIQEQHDLLVLIQDKLTKYFQLDEEQCEQFYLTQDEEKTGWILYAYKVIFSFKNEDDILMVSFDKSLEPDISANIIFSLVRGEIDLQVMECCYESKMDGELYWGEEAERLYRREILLEEKYCGDCKQENLH